MKNTMLGVIDATTSFGSLKELTLSRTLPAVPFGGRYRLIDFTLSNMVNSGIQSVAIFPKYQYRSLMDHLGTGRDWDLNRKRDGLFFFPPPFNSLEDHISCCFHYFRHHLDYFYRSTQEYAVITGSNVVCNLDLKAVLNRHIETGADITEVRKDNTTLNIYVLKKSLLIDLIESEEVMTQEKVCDVIEMFSPKLVIHSYEYDGYAAIIDSVESYYNHSLELLKPEIMSHLFSADRPIYTKVKDEPSTRYTKNSKVSNAQIANGCIIDGHVENSIISRAVKIGKGAVVKNSIILQKTQIGEGACIDGVIIDKDVRIGDNVELKGNPQNPLVIKKGTVQGALMNS